jgi:hypothetical protein
MDDFGLVETVDRFGQGIVVAVADAAHGGFRASLGEALGVFDRYVLRAAIASCRANPVRPKLLGRVGCPGTP